MGHIYLFLLFIILMWTLVFSTLSPMTEYVVLEPLTIQNLQVL